MVMDAVKAMLIDGWSFIFTYSLDCVINFQSKVFLIIGDVKFAYGRARKSAIFELEHRKIFMQAFALAPSPDAQQKDPNQIGWGPYCGG